MHINSNINFLTKSAYIKTLSHVYIFTQIKTNFTNVDLENRKESCLCVLFLCFIFLSRSKKHPLWWKLLLYKLKEGKDKIKGVTEAVRMRERKSSAF